MYLEYRKCTCKDCNIDFAALEFPETHYGDLLMRTKTGETRLLFALDSKEYEEFRILVKKDIQLKQMTDEARSTAVQSLFGIACDLGNDGNPYSIRQRPICPQCKQANVNVRGPIIPLITVDNNLKEISHHAWNQLTMLEKESLVEEAISTYLKNMPVEEKVVEHKKKGIFHKIYNILVSKT